MPDIPNTPATISLGDEVRDTISGFTGIAVARTTWLHGCSRVMVEPRETRDGKMLGEVWFDEGRLTVTQPAAVPPPAPETLARFIGGPRPEAPTSRPGERR